MLGKSHLVGGAASFGLICGPVALATGDAYSAIAIVGGAAIATYAGIAPDVDQPGALITRGWFPFINKHPIGKLLATIASLPFLIMGYFVHSVFGHRGGTHSIAMTAFVTLIVALLTLLFQWPSWIIIAFGCGYFAHLCCDSVTKSGVPFLWPFTDKHYRFPVFFGYITTGDKKEVAVRFMFLWPLAIICYGIAFYLLAHHVSHTLTI